MSWFTARLASFTAQAAPAEVPRPGTATALVEAARPLFAARGYDGVSVRDITAAAGTNLGAITYHFGSKEALWHAVVASAMGPLLERVQAEVGRDDVPPLDRVEAVVRAYFTHLHEHPWIPGVQMRVLLSEEPPAVLAGPLAATIRALTGLILEGQMEGSIRDGDPSLMGISILSVPIHLNLVRHPVRAFTGVDLHAPDTRERLADHASAFVRAALEDRP